MEARYGYERERVGRCAVVITHVHEIEYFCDECDVGNGGDEIQDFVTRVDSTMPVTSDLPVHSKLDAVDA